jgi:hypothetical protein
MKLNEKIKIVFYEGSDGPRLVFAGSETIDFRPLQDVFRSLSANIGMNIDIKSLPFIETTNNIEIRMINIGSIFNIPSKPYQGIKYTESFLIKNFTWSKSTEGWDYIAEIISPIVIEQRPSHQYLSSSEQDDVTVVISRGENENNIT